MSADTQIQCPQCGQQEQRWHTVWAMGTIWKRLRYCNICGATAEGRNFDEAEAHFKAGKFTLERQFVITPR